MRSPGEPGRVRMRVVDAAAMSPALVEAWARVQESEPALASPFLRPEFTLAVAALRSDVRVGVMELDGSPVGFLPFVRRLGGVGAPVASTVSDCQAVIVGRDVTWTAATRSSAPWMNSAVPSTNHRWLLTRLPQLALRAMTA